jgi:radical SAM protein
MCAPKQISEIRRGKRGEMNNFMHHPVSGYPSVAAKHFLYTRAPILVYWEMTRACDLACRHCRAEAITDRDSNELSTDEGRRLLQKVAEFGVPRPHVVMTGGDPLKRPDLFALIENAAALGLSVSVVPSSTQALTREVLQRLKDAGVESIALSLDGSTAPKHDGLRGIPGCFARTVDAAWDALRVGLRLQINSLVSAETLPDLPAVYALLSRFPLMRWKLFTLIAVGRGRALKDTTPEQCETLHHWLYDISGSAPFPVATTEAPHYRRLALTRMRAQGMPLRAILRTPLGRGFGIRDGNGIVFVSYSGNVYPSGFLPLKAGNVRSEDLSDIYRFSKTFTAIRDASCFKGKCGRCEFRKICGGSRARAYASTGDFLESDPLCAYEPRAAKNRANHGQTALTA